MEEIHAIILIAVICFLGCLCVGKHYFHITHVTCVIAWLFDLAIGFSLGH